jgi:hypothetical protein
MNGRKRGEMNREEKEIKGREGQISTPVTVGAHPGLGSSSLPK